jgi:hypothetical protein
MTDQAQGDNKEESEKYVLDDKGVESGSLGDLGRGSGGEVLLLVLSSHGVGVSEDEVDLVGGAALVGSEPVLRERRKLETQGKARKEGCDVSRRPREKTERELMMAYMMVKGVWEQEVERCSAR